MPPDTLLLEEVDDFLCCYCVVTGRTHILDAFPAELVRLLSDRAHTAQELAEAIASQVGEHDTADWLSRIEPLLVDLEGLGLLRQVAG